LTEERIQLAVLKSVELRKKYIAKFQQSATELKREKMNASMSFYAACK
jgi:hypothetical protein